MLFAIPRLNGDSMRVTAARMDLWHADYTRSNRIAYAGYVAMAIASFGNLQNWLPARYPAQEAEKRVAPKAPPPGLQVPAWSVGSWPVAKASLRKHGPPPPVATSRAEGPVPRETASSTVVVVAPIALQPIANKVALGLQAKETGGSLTKTAKD